MCVRVSMYTHTTSWGETRRESIQRQQEELQKGQDSSQTLPAEVWRPETPVWDRRMTSIPKGLFIMCSGISNEFGACDGPGSYFFFKSLYLVSVCVGPRMNEWSKWVVLTSLPVSALHLREDGNGLWCWGLQAKKKVSLSKKKKNKSRKAVFPWLLEIILLLWLTWCVSHHVLYILLSHFIVSF